MAGQTGKAADDGPATRSRDLPPLEERATFLIHRFNAKLSQACQPVFADYELDLYSSRILVALTQYEMLSVGALVELMALPQSTISHQLKRLDKIGYIQRTRSREDNRSVEVRLTPLGRKVAETCNQLSREIYLAAVETFSDAEIETLSSLLKRMYVNLPALSELGP
jgi:MarR family transcriptional regulator, organic hydroperoxide resistance regulator